MQHFVLTLLLLIIAPTANANIVFGIEDLVTFGLVWVFALAFVILLETRIYAWLYQTRFAVFLWVVLFANLATTAIGMVISREFKLTYNLKVDEALIIFMAATILFELPFILYKSKQLVKLPNPHWLAKATGATFLANIISYIFIAALSFIPFFGLRLDFIFEILMG